MLVMEAQGSEFSPHMADVCLLAPRTHWLFSPAESESCRPMSQKTGWTTSGKPTFVAQGRTPRRGRANMLVVHESVLALMFLFFTVGAPQWSATEAVFSLSEGLAEEN